MTKFKKLIIAELIGIVFVVLGAFLFHFLFEWSGNNQFVGVFAAVNESVFEHTKILFYPFIIYSIIEYFFVEISFKQYFIAKSIASISLIIMVIVVFYTYTGIIGYHIPIVDILCSIAYAFIATGISFRLLTINDKITKSFIWVFILFLIVLFSMIIFTLRPPKLPLFYDELNKTYGAVLK